MKKFKLVGFLLLIGIMTSHAQLTDIITGLDFPFKLSLNGNDLYFTEATGGKVSKIDISQESPMLEVLISNANEPLAIAAQGDDLFYFTQDPDQIIRYNLTTGLSSVFLEGMGWTVSDLLLDGNDLYICWNSPDQVGRVDISQPNPMIEILVGTELLSFASGMTKQGNRLFIADASFDQVYVADLSGPFPTTPTPLVTGLSNASGLSVDGDYLYIANINNVYRARIPDGTPSAEIIVDGLADCRTVLLEGGDLYLGQRGGGLTGTGKISKLVVPPAFAELDSVCLGTVSGNLGSVSPTGGVFSGVGVTDNGDGGTFTFNAAAAGLGTATVTYTIGEESATATIEVVPVAEGVCTEGASLTFDGINDFVDVSLTPSALTSEAVAISAWVNINDIEGVFDGIMGWRNDTDADFYLLEVSPTTLEARFRNSSGEAFTITSDQLQLGVWQHWTLSYDGTALTLYLNGEEETSIPASGQLADNDLNFRMGNLDFLGDLFSLDGALDEVRIWDQGLSCFAAAQLYACALGPDQQTNLLGYYQFNQGIASGDNTETTEVMATTGPNGTINNMSLMGLGSNFIADGGVVSGSSCSPINLSTVTSLTGNGIDISNGDDTPTIEDGTDFGDVAFGLSATSEFQIIIDGTLPPPSITVDNPAFTVGAYTDENTFPITFIPTETSLETATVTVTIADCTINNTYTFSVQANGLMLPGAALDFNGENTFVRVPITAGDLDDNAYTISAWVFPENDGSIAGNLDGLFGWRDDSEADFYILQLPPTFIEARFRNSSGQSFTIQTDGLELNTWQHLALTYDGATLTLYKNGEVLDSRTANGSMGSGLTNFRIGLLTSFSVPSFYFDGKVDEVSVWNRALSCFEIAGYQDCELTGDEAELLAYYQFNQGIANGNNSDITALVATTGPAADLLDFDLMGNEDNFIDTGAVPSGISCDPVATPFTFVRNVETDMLITNGDDMPATDDGTDLGNVTIGSTATTSFIVGALDTGGEFYSVSSSNPLFTIEEAPPGTTLTVTFAPEAEGFQSTDIAVQTNDCSIDSLFAFTVQGNGVPELLPGEMCTNSIDISDLFGQTALEPQNSAVYDNTDYGTDDTDPAPDNLNCDILFQHTIWYSFTGDGNTYSIKSADCDGTSMNLDVSAHLYTGDCGTLAQLACNDDDPTTMNSVGFGMEVATDLGQTYLLVVDAVIPNETGTFCLEVTNQGPVAVTTIEEDNLRLFPNPTSGTVQLPLLELERVEVYDATGRLVLRQAQPNQRLELGQQAAGLYFLKLFAGDKVYSAKIVKE